MQSEDSLHTISTRMGKGEVDEPPSIAANGMVRRNDTDEGVVKDSTGWAQIEGMKRAERADQLTLRAKRTYSA